MIDKENDLNIDQDDLALNSYLRKSEADRDKAEIERIKADVINGYKRHNYEFQDEQEALLAAARRQAKRNRESYKKKKGTYLFLCWDWD